MACRRVLLVLAVAALLAATGCSKTQDTAADPMRFGRPPVIESVNQGGTPPIQSERTVSCDFLDPVTRTDAWNAFFYADGPFEDYCDENDRHPLNGNFHPGEPKRKTRRLATYGLAEGVMQLIGGTYTEARFEARVSDPDSTPEQDNVLLVTASFVLNAGSASASEVSLVVLDDGSQSLFNRLQQSSLLQANCHPEIVTTPDVETCRDVAEFDENNNFVCPPPGYPDAMLKNCPDPSSPNREDCQDCSLESEPLCNTCLHCEIIPGTTTSFPLCEQATYQLTTNDAVKDDHLFSRGFAFFNLGGSLIRRLLMQDCIVKETSQAPYTPGGAQTLEFTLEAVDRQGNLAEWGEKLRVAINDNQFNCSGDQCLCCWLEHGQFGGPCENEPGLYAPEDPSGKCDTEDNPTPAIPPLFDDEGGCFAAP